MYPYTIGEDVENPSSKSHRVIEHEYITPSQSRRESYTDKTGNSQEQVPPFNCHHEVYVMVVGIK